MIFSLGNREFAIPLSIQFMRDIAMRCPVTSDLRVGKIRHIQKLRAARRYLRVNNILPWDRWKDIPNSGTDVPNEGSRGR
jgi:hypothetical protein